jgi:hypothetical protein
MTAAKRSTPSTLLPFVERKGRSEKLVAEVEILG